MALPEGIEFREYRPEDAQGFLSLHDSRWRAIPPDFWHHWSHQPNVTASMAVVGGRVVGQIPFHLRDFLVRPGVTVRAAQEYSLIVAEEMRSRGIGSALIAEAARFLSGRCEVMVVYRGGERTPGYRFYERTGHYDLTYHRMWLPGAGTPAQDERVKSADVTALLDRENEVFDVFQSAYGERGGFPSRRPGYWEGALASVIFCEVSGNFRSFYIEDAGGLVGYALCLEGRGESKRSETPRAGARVLELATRDGDAESAVVLLRHAAYAAQERGLTLSVQKSDESVYARPLRRAGFVQAPRAERSMMTMAHVFDPQALAQRVLSESHVSLPAELAVWTPERESVLNPGAGARQMTLEMKEHDLARLLFCRLDLVAAVKEERVTVVAAEPGEVEAVAEAFPFSPWDYHALDYI